MVPVGLSLCHCTGQNTIYTCTIVPARLSLLNKTVSTAHTVLPIICLEEGVLAALFERKKCLASTYPTCQHLLYLPASTYPTYQPHPLSTHQLGLLASTYPTYQPAPTLQTGQSPGTTLPGVLASTTTTPLAGHHLHILAGTHCTAILNIRSTSST